jgi:pimeloyl-ACP methyl ester carboxylesterase
VPEKKMGSLFTRYHRDKLTALARLKSESQLLRTSLGVVEVARFGHGSAVLISHGSGGGYDMGLWLARLIGGQHQFIAPSRFGYLRSPLPANPSPEFQADTYAAMLDTLKINSVIMIGLSAGGASALQFAIRHSARCRGLVMISAASRPIPPLPSLLRVIYAFMLRSDFIPWLLYSAAPHLVYRSNGVSPALIERIKDESEKIHLLDALYQTTFPSTLRRNGMMNDMQQLNGLPLYPIEHIAAPTLVVHAVDDPIIPFSAGEYAANTIPGAQFLRLEDGGHFTCVVHREEITPAIQGFIKRHSS